MADFARSKRRKHLRGTGWRPLPRSQRRNQQGVRPGSGEERAGAARQRKERGCERGRSAAWRCFVWNSGPRSPGPRAAQRSPASRTQEALLVPIVRRRRGPARARARAASPRGDRSRRPRVFVSGRKRPRGWQRGGRPEKAVARLLGGPKRGAAAWHRRPAGEQGGAHHCSEMDAGECAAERRHGGWLQSRAASAALCQSAQPSIPARRTPCLAPTRPPHAHRRLVREAGASIR